MGRGRRPEVELAALRARIETLLLSGLRALEIHRGLTGPENPAPIVLSERQVRAHIAAIERGWAERASRATLEADRGRAIAQAEDTIRVATSRSALNARSNVGVGYMNAGIKAQDQLARLRGLYAPTQTELSGPGSAPLGVTVTLADHPAEHLDPAEEARRLRQQSRRRRSRQSHPRQPRPTTRRLAGTAFPTSTALTSRRTRRP